MKKDFFRFYIKIDEGDFNILLLILVSRINKITSNSSMLFLLEFFWFSLLCSLLLKPNKAFLVAAFSRSI